MSTSPTGTVTFLFTDIEGSTKLSQQHPDEMPVLLTRHNQILHQAIEIYNGYVFQVVGDSFAAAFHSASDALNAAVDAQRMLCNEAWAPAPIKVRMGIHTGAAQLQLDSNDNPYSGYATIALTQRIMSAGHGGQVLISGATRELVRDVLPENTELLDVGEKRLKDLLRPEHLYQLNISGLPSTFPPLKMLDAFLNNLPTQLTSFIGRENEIAEIKQELELHRLVTFTGSGGTGKTRLSLQVAADLLEKFDHGVWFVELAPLTDSDLIPQTILSTIGVQEQQGKTPLEVLKEYLHEKQTLIVIDNCEHLVSASAEVANALLNVAPKLKILASSREALGVKGEMSYPVPSLSLPDIKHLPAIEQLSQYEAVRLFIDRALLVAPHFVMDKDNAPFIAQICYRLDGIPLAIELAAARIKMLSVEQISTRLDDRFRLLTSGARTALPRQQTLRALIDWSYDILSEKERLLLCRLSIFAGGWTLEAAEGVCAGDSIETYDVLDLLAQLVNKSLVVVVGQSQSGERRYRMLETVRQYALEKLLEAGDSEIIRQRHASFFLELVGIAKPELRGPSQQIWFERLDREKDNSRAALNWLLANDLVAVARLASGLFWFWHAYCYWGEGREWYDRLLKSGMDLDKQGPLTTEMRAQVLFEAGWLAINEMDTNQSLLLSEQSLALYRELGDKGGIAMANYTLGWVAYYLSDYSKARILAEDSLTLFMETGLKLQSAGTLNLLGNIARSQGYYDQAIQYYKESLKWAREAGDKQAIAYTLSMWGYLAWFQGDLEQATTLSEESLQLSREVRLEWNVAETLTLLGDIARVKGEYQKASKLYDECDVIWERLGHQRERGYLLWSRGWLAKAQGNHEQATDFFREGLILWREVGDKQHIAECLEGLAGIGTDLGKAELSAKLMGMAEKIRDETNSPMPPIDRANYDRDVAVIRFQLGESDFIEAWEKGRALKMDEAIEFALREDNE